MESIDSMSCVLCAWLDLSLGSHAAPVTKEAGSGDALE